MTNHENREAGNRDRRAAVEKNNGSVLRVPAQERVPFPAPEGETR